MSTYKELDKNIKKMLRNKDKEKSITDPEEQIDTFYNSNYQNINTLYSRSYKLERDDETFGLILLPIIITVVFGIYLALLQNGYSELSSLLESYRSSVSESINILNSKGQEGLPVEMVDEMMATLETLNTKTYINFSKYIMILIGLMIILFLLLYKILIDLYIIRQPRQLIRKYELDKIEPMIKVLRNKKVDNLNPTILKIENDTYYIEYKLVQVHKK